MTVTAGRAALAIVNLIISRGADNPFTFRYSTLSGSTPTPVDLTGWTAKSQIRQTPDGPVWLEITGITLGADGSIGFIVTHDQTADIEWDRRVSGVWDMELTDTMGTVIRFAMGTVAISHDVTRDVV